MGVFLDGHQEAGRTKDAPRGPSNASAYKKTPRQRPRALQSGDWLEGQRYQLLERIAQGSTCSVFRARDAHRGGEVAIKLFSPEFLRSPLAGILIQTEYRASTQISHTHVVQVLGHGQHCGCPYLVMEYLRGDTLLDRLVRQGALAPREALSITRDVLSALSALHARGIVHRDIKPQNIVLVPHVDGYGRVTVHAKLCDFGIAVIHGRSGTLGVDGQQSICGTPEYMSPEQAQARSLDGRSDLYSTGIMLYQMLTGDLPFKSDSPLHLTALQVEQELPAPSAINPAICHEAEQVIYKATQKSPKHRFASALEMRAAIIALSHSEWAKTTEVKAPKAAPVAYVKPNGGKARKQPAWAKANTLRLRRLPERLPQAVAAVAMFGLGALAIGSRFVRDPEPAALTSASASNRENPTPAGESTSPSVEAAAFADTEHWLLPPLWGENEAETEPHAEVAKAHPTAVLR